MAQIPTLVARRSLDTGGVVQYSGNDPVAGQLERLGNQGMQVAERGLSYESQRERNVAMVGFDKLRAEVEGEQVQITQQAEPGAIGLSKKLNEMFEKRSSEWLASVPKQHQAEFQERIAAQRVRFATQSAATEKQESDRFQVDGISKRAEGAKAGVLQSGPDAITAWKRDVDEFIDSTTLTPIQKDKAKKAVAADLEDTGFQSLIRSDPDAAKRIAKGWGVGNTFSGSAVDRTMQLLRDKEGFRSSTYWDVNADRVGYGSDTITGADGSIRQVKRGDTVSRDDAERDLRRRTQESLAGIQKLVGDDAFKQLNPNQQAALASVAYNYGSLPQSVAAAVKTGDTEQIAKSIEALQGHNNGVNRARRMSEAALARSSGDGPVQGVYQPDERFANVTAERRLALAGNADLAFRRQAEQTAAAETALYNQRLNALQTDIIDNKATLADVQNARQAGWLTDAGDIQKLIGQINSRDKGLEDSTNFNRAMANPDHVWNPVDSDQKDWAEAGFKSQGSTMQALQNIAEKTGIVPKSAAVAMNGALFSPDPKRVESALQTAANLIGGKYPDVFAGAENGKALTEAGLAFREYTLSRGMSATDATKKIMEERTPEYERTIKAKIKSEDLDQIVKKNLTDSDIRGAFDASFLGLAPNPKLTFNPEMRQRAMGDYETAFRDHYLKNGDVGLSKTLALDEMKRTWGVTNVNGSNIVMKYPPDRSPAYAGIENVGQRFASQAVSAIKDWNGVDVARSNIQINEVRQTAERYLRGQPPTYMLSYTDKNGVLQTIPRPFYADPGLMREQQTSDREKAFNAADQNAQGNKVRERQRQVRDEARQRISETRQEVEAEETSRATAINRDESGRATEIVSRGRRMKLTRDERGRLTGFEEVN